MAELFRYPELMTIDQDFVDPLISGISDV